MASTHSGGVELTDSSAMQEYCDDTLVEFRGIRKTYDGKSQVIKHLDLVIKRGEFLTLLGPSGSGKTTCLMMLAGFEVPTGGQMFLNGQMLNRVPPHKRNIGMVFQNYALFPHMTVAQNVAYPLQARGIASNQRAEKVRQALNMVQMGKFADRHPAQLSGGQQQRVALARALVFEPKLVLMDEPLGALDKQLREQMQLELKALHRRLGITFMYVTHDQSEALTMSDRVAVFDQGVVQQLATVDRLYECPDNLFVAGFIGDNNRFIGSVDSVSDTTCQLRLSGNFTLRGIGVGPVRRGQEATACIRPERIRILPPGSPSNNGLPATVKDLIYFGDHVRVRCTVTGQDDCFVKLPLADHALSGLAQATPVMLDVDPQQLRVFV